MPVYEYRCVGCDHRFSELVRGPEDQPACPACGLREPERLLSSVAPAGRAHSSFTPAQTRRDGGHGHGH